MEPEPGLDFINTANAADLIAIEGVGRRTADAIVAFRKRNGVFRSIDDLKRIDGVGDVLVERIRHAARRTKRK